MIYRLAKAHEGGWVIDLSSFRVVESYGERGPSFWCVTDPGIGKRSWLWIVAVFFRAWLQ